MNSRKFISAMQVVDQEFTIRPQAFVFFDKKTGTRRFEVKANADGSLPVDQVASLLAANCVMRGQTPQDFGILVAAGEDILGGLEKHTEKLIQHCQTFQSPIRLTRREREVLHEVLQIFSNKDIADKVHISVRTVKFHVSALLAKFGVASRLELIRRALNFFTDEESSNGHGVPLLLAYLGIGSIQESSHAGYRRAPGNCLERRSCR
jgi:DNA-binding CsgD family transcriptional regulator